MQYKFIKFIMLSGALFTACQQETIDIYEMDEAKVYFQQQTSSGANGAVGYSTVIQFSFLNKDPEVWKNVVFKGRVQLLGEVKDYDRAVRVVVDTEKTTMTTVGEDKGYEINLDTLYIKAGHSYGEIGVRFFRNKSIRNQEDTLVLKLEPNEHFTVLEKYRANNAWNSSAKDLDGARFTFCISEIAKEPGSWSNVINYFGVWNPTKYAYVNSFFGFTEDDWLWYGNKISNARLRFYATMLQTELQKKADAGNPVYDEDGSYMQLPEPYKVDYSNVIINS